MNNRFFGFTRIADSHSPEPFTSGSAASSYPGPASEQYNYNAQTVSNQFDSRHRANEKRGLQVDSRHRRHFAPDEFVP